MTFEDLGLDDVLLDAVEDKGYITPTPIQEKAIPVVLEGKDVLGCAQTGTGKTAAFALPILHHLLNKPLPKDNRRPIRCLVLSPTRELAAQIEESFGDYGRHTDLRATVVYGGVRQRSQVAALRAGVDVLVATPGRLLDLMGQRHIDLSQVEYLVLDEADHMLDMGFIDDVRDIISYVPRKRQTLFFSATMPPEIQHLADTILKTPVSVQVAPVASTADTVEQAIYHVERLQKPHMLVEFLKLSGAERTLIFTKTKQGADRVATQLIRAGIKAEAIHGDKNQKLRDRAMELFKSDDLPVLVATDIAARGLDIDAISHVVNYDVPHEPEVYVHRIGRTGRAGATGRAVTFCDIEERSLVKTIEKLIRKSIPVIKVPDSVPTLGQLLRGEKPGEKPVGEKSVAGEASKPAMTPVIPPVSEIKYCGFGRTGAGVTKAFSPRRRRR